MASLAPLTSFLALPAAFAAAASPKMLSKMAFSGWAAFWSPSATLCTNVMNSWTIGAGGWAASNMFFSCLEHAMVL
jgi:hypothetical protein